MSGAAAEMLTVSDVSTATTETSVTSDVSSAKANALVTSADVSLTLDVSNAAVDVSMTSTVSSVAALQLSDHSDVATATVTAIMPGVLSVAPIVKTITTEGMLPSESSDTTGYSSHCRHSSGSTVIPDIVQDVLRADLQDNTDNNVRWA